jgi:transcriptional regulator with GAF, ATPase, and Fis domain
MKPPSALRIAARQAESAVVLSALIKANGNETRAAQDVGLTRYGFQLAIKRLAVRPPCFYKPSAQQS